MGIFQNLFSLDTSTRNQVALIQNMMTLALVLLAILHAASGRLIHRHHHHHHSPAAAPSAKCSGSRTAVEGFPKKCYVYYYQPNKVDWFASYNLCHSSREIVHTRINGGNECRRGKTDSCASWKKSSVLRELCDVRLTSTATMV